VELLQPRGDDPRGTDDARKAKLASAYRARAKLFLQEKDWPAVLADLERSIGADPRHGSAEVADDHKERGLILVKLGRAKDALAEFDAALGVRPDFVVAQRLRAELLMELGRYAEAQDAWDHYLGAASRSLAAFLQAKEPVANAYRARGVTRVKLAKPSAALEDYNHALELEENSVTYAFRGWVYVVAEAPYLALRDFEKALELDPKNADACNGRGWCRVTLNQPGAAVADADQALELGPRDPRLVYNAARIYSQAMLKIAGDRTLKANKALEMQTRYKRKALELIREALDLAPTPTARRQFWQEYILQDTALALVRQTPEFVGLAKRNQTKAPAGP
jgi:tetratricopeptide (TPR) repeat protein